jgi:hypothetical protein
VDVNVSSECPGLYDVYGEEFEKLAMKRAGKGRKNNQSAGVVGEDPRISN